MARRLPFKTRQIRRHGIPACERNGHIAQEMSSHDLVFVLFHQTKTEVEYPNGLPIVDLGSEIYEGEPGPGVRDTTVLGFLRGKSAIVLVDVVNIDGRSLRATNWESRLEALRLLCAGFSERGNRVYPLARTWRRGLMRAYDEVVAEKGAGLLFRMAGRAQVVLCTDENREIDSPVGEGQ
jgi:hypothetical protein